MGMSGEGPALSSGQSDVGAGVDHGGRGAAGGARAVSRPTQRQQALDRQYLQRGKRSMMHICALSEQILTLRIL